MSDKHEGPRHQQKRNPLSPDELQVWRDTTRAAMRKAEISSRRLAAETGFSEATIRNWLKVAPGPSEHGREVISAALETLATRPPLTDLEIAETAAREAEEKLQRARERLEREMTAAAGST